MKRVLVIGDAILDVYRECSLKKECPDAPGIQAAIEESIDSRPGGAANVAVNLAALAPDVEVDLIGAVSSRLYSAIGSVTVRVGLKHSVTSDESLTKERILVDGHLVVRVDNFTNITPIDSRRVKLELQRYLLRSIPDLILLSDYAGGTVDAGLIAMLLPYRDRLLVDTKLTDLSVFSRSLLVKLNEAELHAVARKGDHSPEEFFDFMVVTLGARGAEVVTNRPGNSPHISVRRNFMVPGHEADVVDVCGCGDTFLAGIAAAFLRGFDIYESLRFANAAAATVVSLPRTAVGDLEATLKLIGRTGNETC